MQVGVVHGDDAVGSALVRVNFGNGHVLEASKGNRWDMRVQDEGGGNQRRAGSSQRYVKNRYEVESRQNTLACLRTFEEKLVP